MWTRCATPSGTSWRRPAGANSLQNSNPGISEGYIANHGRCLCAVGLPHAAQPKIANTWTILKEILVQRVLYGAGRMVCRLQCTGKEILCTLRQTCIGTVPWQYRTVPAASVSVSIAELGGRVRYLGKMAQVHAHSEGKVGSSDVLVSHHESLTIKGS